MVKVPVYEECKKMHSHSATVFFSAFFVFDNHKNYGKNLWHVNYELHFAVQLLYKHSSL